MDESDFAPSEPMADLPSATDQPQHNRVPEAILRAAKAQEPFWALFRKLEDLYFALPTLSPRQVDPLLVEIHETALSAAESAGISRMSVPKLKDCCGRPRHWDADPGKSQVLAPPPEEEPARGWGLGDALKKFFSLFGFKPCAGCERRRRFLNRLRWPGKGSRQ